MIKPDYVTLFLPPLFFLVTGEPLNREKLLGTSCQPRSLKPKEKRKIRSQIYATVGEVFGNFFADQMVITARELTSDDGIQL